jgi:lipopolysaccharide heptosyltransferase II
LDENGLLSKLSSENFENCLKNGIEQILVIRLSSLGDIFLSTPLIRALKNKYPGSEISFLCREEYLNAVNTNPNITNFIALKTDVNEAEVIEKIQNGNFDLIIDLQNNFRSRKLLKTVKVPLYKFSKPNIKKFLLVNFKLNVFGKYLSIPELYAKSVPGLELDGDGVDFNIPEQYKTSLSTEEKYIGFIPGSKHLSKRWPDDYFIQLGKLLNKYGYTIVVFGGKDDKEVCAKITSQITKAKDLSNDNNLYQTAADMKMCRLVTGNDSGLMHVASSFFIPLIVLFGSSVEQFGFAPYKREAVILQNETLKCRPCSHFGKDQCPKGHFKCMVDLTPNIVFEKIKKALAL